MKTVEVAGAAYEVEFNLYTLEMIEKEYGGWRKMQEKLQDANSSVQTTMDLFRMMRNTAKELKGEEENATGKELRRMKPRELGQLTVELTGLIRSAMKSETAPGGEASEEHQLGYEDEDDAKNAGAGMRPASVSSTDTPSLPGSAAEKPGT